MARFFFFFLLFLSFFNCVRIKDDADEKVHELLLCVRTVKAGLLAAVTELCFVVRGSRQRRVQQKYELTE